MTAFFTGGTGVGSGPHLDFRIWDVESGGYIDPSGFTDVLTVGGKPLTEQFRMTSPYGYRGDIGIPGASKHHEGIDYATPEGTEVNVLGGQYLTTFEGPRGGIMSQYAITRDGKPYEVLLLHGSKSNPIRSRAALTNYKRGEPPVMPIIATAKERAQNYSNMSKGELDAAYDKMRSDPAKAGEEGMKMHKAFFGKK